MRIRPVDPLTNAMERLLARPSPNGVGLYFYPASSNDLTPLLLLPPDNPLGCHMITTDELREEDGSTRQSWVVPVLCDCCENFSPDPDWFLNQPYPNLWDKFATDLNVVSIESLRLPGRWYLGVAELTRAGRRYSHPFAFAHEDAHSLIPKLDPSTRFAVLTMIRCSGFSGGPTGECSRTISEQIAELRPTRMPQFVVCDEQSRYSFEQSTALRHYQINNETGLEGWGWGNVSVFVKRPSSTGRRRPAGARPAGV